MSNDTPPEPDYSEREHARDTEYKNEFNEWLEGMSDEERAEAEKLGITGPHIDANGVGSPELDESRIADESYMPNFDFDAPEEEFDLKAAVERQANRIVRRVIIEILEAKNARLTTECIAFVTGVGFLGNSETDIAKKFNITRAAVSKRCVELCDKLGLPPSRAMKSEAARESYRKSRLEVVGLEGK